MINIKFSNGTELNTDSFIINEDSVKLINKINIVKDTKPLFQLEAAVKSLKSSVKLPPNNYKLSEENRIEICRLWYNSIVIDLEQLASMYLVRSSTIRYTLQNRGVKYGYINSVKLFNRDRQIWWNINLKNIKSLNLQNA